MSWRIIASRPGSDRSAFGAWRRRSALDRLWSWRALACHARRTDRVLDRSLPFRVSVGACDSQQLGPRAKTYTTPTQEPEKQKPGAEAGLSTW